MKKVTLGDVCNKAGSNIAQKDLQENEGKYPIYGASGLIKKVDFYQQELPYIAVVKDGAGIGRTMLLPGHSSVIGTVQYILPIDRETVDLKYLYYAIVHMNLSKYFSGATIPHIYYKDYKKEPLRLPELEKQREIAIVFQRIDELTAKREQQLKGLDELVKSRFIELFGDPDVNSKGWNECALSEKLNVVGGYAFKSDQFDEERGIPVLRIGNINAGFFRPVNLVYWHEDESLERYIVYPGELVMSLTGTVGKDDYGNVCILGDDYGKYYLNQRNAKLEIVEGIDKYYLSQLLKFEQIKKRLTGISRGVRQANISNKDILNLVVPVPPMEIQKQFSVFVAQTDKSKYYNFTSYKYCVLVANLIRQEWMLCQTLSF